MWKSILGKIFGIITGVASVAMPVHYATTTKPVVSVLQTQTQVTTRIATSTPAKPAPKKVVQKTKIKISAKTVTAKTVPIQVTQTPPAPEPPPDFAAINTFARGAIVNILCSAKGSELSPISGTGMMVTENGVILTNAHIAQYFLLHNYREPDFVDCVIRTGSPAVATYHAELVYISPTWVKNNKDILKEEEPKGTGENDFAFLRITDAVNGSPLPVFTHIPLNIRENIAVGEPVLLVSYPAGFLGGMTILQDLNVASGETFVQQIFTYTADTTDIISVGGTVVSQKGSSGGAVIDRHGSIVGMISTESQGNTTSSRELYAITPAYINRDLESELGVSLADFLDSDIGTFAKKFQTDTAPLLMQELTADLNTTTPAN